MTKINDSAKIIENAVPFLALSSWKGHFSLMHSLKSYFSTLCLWNYLWLRFFGKNLIYQGDFFRAVLSNGVFWVFWYLWQSLLLIVHFITLTTITSCFLHHWFFFSFFLLLYCWLEFSTQNLCEFLRLFWTFPQLCFWGLLKKDYLECILWWVRFSNRKLWYL